MEYFQKIILHFFSWIGSDHVSTFVQSFASLLEIIGAFVAVIAAFFGSRRVIRWRKVKSPNKIENNVYADVNNKISPSRLPNTGEYLVGRQKELKRITNAWNNSEINIVSVIGMVGVGKTQLVKCWREQLHKNTVSDVQLVYDWSFFNQGTSESSISSELFIDSALKWFGETKPHHLTSPWEKGERLSYLIKKYKTLLILDGVEVLLYPPGSNEGSIKRKEDGFRALIIGLAEHNPGLCIITSRIPIKDLIHLSQTTVKIDLNGLSASAGAALLRKYGVVGHNSELEAISEEYRGNALSLTLLGTQLRERFNCDITKRYQCHLLSNQDDGEAWQARSMIRSYERWFIEDNKLVYVDVLRLLGLFNRPVTFEEINSFREAQPIPELTENLSKVDKQKLESSLLALKKTRLITISNTDTIDIHPLIREFFADKSKEYALATKEAHSRLFDFLRKNSPEHPKNLEQMMPLFNAIRHGCMGGREHEALENVYRQKVLRNEEYYAFRKLGLIDANLSTLSCFFKIPWSAPLSSFNNIDKAWLLNYTGYSLMVTCQLREATVPLERGITLCRKMQYFVRGAITGDDLSMANLMLGDFQNALDYAFLTLELAELSNDTYQRISKRTTLAHILASIGEISKAKSLYQEAVNLQKEYEPSKTEFVLTSWWWGYRYISFLLPSVESFIGHVSKNDLVNIRTKSKNALRIIYESQKLKNKKLMEFGLEYLNLSRALFGLSITDQKENNVVDTSSTNFIEAKKCIKTSIKNIKQAGHEWMLPAALLMLTALYRHEGKISSAYSNLKLVRSITNRGNMLLFQIDAAVETCRILSKDEKIQDIQKVLDEAISIILKTSKVYKPSNVVNSTNTYKKYCIQPGTKLSYVHGIQSLIRFVNEINNTHKIFGKKELDLLKTLQQFPR